MIVFLTLLSTLLSPSSSSYYYPLLSLSLPSNQSITHLQLSSSNTLLFISTLLPSSKSNLHIYSINSTHPSSSYLYTSQEVLSIDPGIINLLLFCSSKNTLILGLRNNNIQIYHVTENVVMELIGSIEGWDMEEKQMDLSVDGKYLVVGSRNGTVACFERVTSVQNKKATPKISYKLLTTLQILNKTQIVSLKISPNNSRLYVSFSNSTLCIYNLILSNYVFDMMIQEKEGDIVTEINLSKEGKIMTLGTKKGKIRVYVGNSKGKGLYERQVLEQKRGQIMRVQIGEGREKGDGGVMLVSDREGEVWQYGRMAEGYNWIWDEDKSDRFSNISFPPPDPTNNNFIPSPLLSSDTTLILHPSSPSTLSLLLSCNSTQPHCSKCTNSTLCLSCSPFFYHPSSSLPSLLLPPCLPCSTGCLHCQNNLFCFSCDTSYYLDPLLGICIPCSRDIVNCRKCDGKGKCIECVDGYELEGNQCGISKEGVESPNKVYDLRGEEEREGRREVEMEVLWMFVIVCVIVLFLLVVGMAGLYCVLKVVREQNRIGDSRSVVMQSERSLNRMQ